MAEFDRSASDVVSVLDALTIERFPLESGNVSHPFWCGQTGSKLYIQSGFTTTYRHSQSVASVGTPAGITWDTVNATWLKRSPSPKLLLQSGGFSSTIKTSQAITWGSGGEFGATTNGQGGPTGHCDFVADKLFRISGQFSSTISASLSVASAAQPADLSWDGTNTIWSDSTSGTPKHVLQSGQFTSTIKSSISRSAVFDSNLGSSWDGADTIGIGVDNSPFEAKLFAFSGQFTSTIHSSVSVLSLDNAPRGIEWGDFLGRTATNERAASDSVAVADSVAAGLEAERAASDAVAIADAAVLELEAERSAADALAVSDQAAAGLDASRSASDAVIVADLLTREAIWERTIGDVVTVVDSTLIESSGTIELILADAISVSDVLTAEPQPGIPADSVSLVDLVSAELLAERTVADVLAITDQVAREADYSRGAADAVSAVDSALAGLDFLITRLISDTISITDRAGSRRGGPVEGPTQLDPDQRVLGNHLSVD